jgi:hypothetical protein
MDAHKLLFWDSQWRFSHIFRLGQSKSGESLATALRLILLETLFCRSWPLLTGCVLSPVQ